MFVKICGTTSEDDALLAVAMGADAIGFIFAPSLRQVSPSLVSQIVRRLPPEIMTVGVFRDESAEKVIEIVEVAGLKAAQLHGSELPGVTKAVSTRVEFAIKAFVAGSDAMSDAREHGADAILIDSQSPGSGEIFDWSLVEGIDPGMKVILAGGLTPRNVARAIETVQPWGVDVVTGVESSPGRKDARKLREFIESAKSGAGR